MIILSFNITSFSGFTTKSDGNDVGKLKEIISENTQSILRTLEPFEVPATFFIDAELVYSLQDLIKTIYRNGHEIGIFHRQDWNATQNAKEIIKKTIGKSVKGIRIQGKVDPREAKNHEFIYVSTIEDFRLSNLFKKITEKNEIYTIEELDIIPQSFAPYSQLPYNENVFQFMPVKYYENMLFETLKNRDYVLIYLNIWQFTEFKSKNIKIPFYKNYNAGKKLEDKLNALLEWINDNDMATSTIKDYII